MKEEEKLKTNMAGIETNQASPRGAPTLCEDMGHKDKSVSLKPTSVLTEILEITLRVGSSSLALVD